MLHVVRALLLIRTGVSSLLSSQFWHYLQLCDQKLEKNSYALDYWHTGLDFQTSFRLAKYLQLEQKSATFAGVC